MTTQEDSVLLTRVGPGTPMGETMRQYWIPAALSPELHAGGDPVRLLLLGERLIAFRDRDGRVGIMDHRCPHRCASLFFGRNEGDGIRCVYHGWKFNADGDCTDMPNVPSRQDFRHKVRAKAYRVVERNGLVWVYMGGRAEPPGLPALEPALIPEGDVRLFMVQRECNWLQALEGDIDTSHFSWLHAGGITPDTVPPDQLGRFNVIDRAPEYHVAETPWGTMYGAYRDAGNGRTYWRVAHFLFPFWSMTPDGDFTHHITSRAWVPMDDSHTMFLHMSWVGNRQGIRTGRDGEQLPGLSVGNDYLPNDTGWYGRWRLAANASNDYRLDRAAQRNGNFTGIEGIHLQDQAITESMGAVTDHEFEHLSPSDLMITRTRRRLVQVARTFFGDGDPPPGVEDPDVYLGARGGDFLADAGVDWHSAYRDELRASHNPTGRLQAAE